MPRKQSIFGKRDSKNDIYILKVTPRGISFSSSSNITSSSPSYCVGIKIKPFPEEKHKKELPAFIGDDYSYYLFVVYDDLKMGDMIDGDFSLIKHTLSQQYWYFNNGDVFSVYVILNKQNLSQGKD